jgi:hypothetical protein
VKIIRLSPIGLALLWLVPPVSALNVVATRQFPAWNCRYTLPGKGWAWVDPPKADALFLARDGRERALILGVDRVNVASLTPEVVDWHDQGMAQAKFRKRGGRLIGFLGLPCYQYEGTTPDGNSVVTRVLVVNGLAYHLTLVGTEMPVEQDSDFESCMGGFALLVPPAPPKPVDPTAAIVVLAVIVGGASLFVFLIARANRQPKRKPPPEAWLTLGDDFLREVKRPVADAYTPTVRVPGVSSAPTVATLAPPIDVIRDTSRSGPCRACRRYVPADVSQCPFCKTYYPNPSRKSGNAGFGLLFGALVGAVIGSFSCWGITGDAGSAVAGLLAGALGGAIPGLAGGVLYDRIKRKRSNGGSQ